VFAKVDPQFLKLRLQLLYLCLQIRESTPADLGFKLRHLRLESRNLAFVVRDAVLQIGDLTVQLI
jgi:hypothetical protein